MREWEQFIPEEERKIYEKAGYKNKDTFGRNPALLIIDVITGFTGTKAMDIMDAIDEFPTSCGKVAWDALPKIQALLQACRDADVPVIYSFGYPVFLVEECVFDRSRTSHLVNLFEMNAKYATVIQLNEALNYVQRLRKIEGRQALAR